MIMAAQSYERFLVLRGHAPIQQFVRFVKTRSIDGQRMDEIDLTHEWRRANAHLRELESTDSASEEVGALHPLPRELAARAEEALKDAATRQALGFLPHRWAMVELDRLTVWQKHVNLEFSDSVRGSLSAYPSAHDLLRVAIGVHRQPPDLLVTMQSSNTFGFSSPSSDVRVLGAVPLDPASVTGYEPFGRAVAVLAVYIGFSVNCMWAVQMGNRVLLVNGTHRAHALRAHGVTHFPCVVSQISNQDDLDLVGLSEQGESSNSYFTRPRPPLLKDFFDEQLCKTISVPRSHYNIQLDLKFERTRTPIHGDDGRTSGSNSMRGDQDESV
jgi:hypothetical protein